MADRAIALIGNPNTGKSSLFNALTGLRQKVGNYPGVTVERKVGKMQLEAGLEVEITDYPGAYSLFAKSPDERVPIEALVNGTGKAPDLVVYVADATQLKRSLMMMTQLLDLGLPVLLCISMADEAKARGITIDKSLLEKQLRVKVVLVNGRNKDGVADLKQTIAQSFQNTEIKATDSSKVWWTLAPEKKEALDALALEQGYKSGIHLGYDLVWFSRADEVDAKAQDLVKLAQSRIQFDSGHWTREELYGRSKAIEKAIKDVVGKAQAGPFERRQRAIDDVLTHRVWGYVIFLIVLMLIFQGIFSLASYPMDWIEQGMHYVGELIRDTLPKGEIRKLVVDGIIPGLTGVLIFIPQIAILFLFISALEDTGYLARVGFMMDKTMRRFGLNGKSVIPLISGTACAVPAIMATRNIENFRSRLITIMVTPLMSCSARLPVYILLIGIIVPEDKHFGFLSLQGLALIGMYLVGFVGTLVGARILHWVLRTRPFDDYYIVSLPSYKVPGWRNVGIEVFQKVLGFAGAAKIIVAISIVLWFLSAHGRGEAYEQAEMQYELAENANDTLKMRDLSKEKLAESYAGRLGHAIEPVVRPLGYDWKIGIAIVTSFAAREVFVGTMKTLYGLEGDDEEDKSISTALQNERSGMTGKKVYDRATVVSLLLFYALAMQCMSTLATTYRETGKWQWALYQFLGMTGLAYLASLIAYQLLKA